MNIKIHIIILLIAAVISLIGFHESMKRRPANGSISLGVLMILLCGWALFEAFYFLSENFIIKLLWYNLRFLSITCIPIAWLLLALKYTKLDRFITKQNMLILTIIPFITNVLTWTNSFHNLMWKKQQLLKIDSTLLLVSDNALWFWVHTGFSYLLILTGTILLFSSFFTLPSIYKKQTGFMLIGAFIPWFGNALITFELIELKYIDITPLLFLITCILFFIALFKFKFLDLIPIARNSIIEGMHDPIVILDLKKRVVDINPSAAKIIGKTPSDILGKPVAEAFSRWPYFIEKYGNVTEADEKIMLCLDNKTKYYDLKLSQLHDKKNRPTGQLFVMRDITILEEAMRQLEASRRDAESANQSKSLFLANMSHEIRTPMNTISTASELLHQSHLTDEQKEYVDIIRNSCDSLLSIINDILDLSKIEAGRFEVEEIDFNIREVIDQTIKTLSVQSQKKNLKLDYVIEDTIPKLLTGDSIRLKQILVNLINNAIKFTSKGYVKLKVEMAYADDNLIRVLFAVSDTGIGITDNKIDKLFHNFEQLDSSTTRKYGGTGLGLSICKHLTEMLGGTLAVESKPGEGSTFSFQIPFKIAKKPTEVPKFFSSSSKTKNAKKHARILLAEDNKTNQFLMLKLLEKYGVSTDTAENGKVVLQKFEPHKYNLILMDIQMPEIDGYEVTRRIRQKEKESGSHIPIIALTANAMKEDKDKCLESGMDHYLSKPVRVQNLYSVLEKFLN